MIVLLWNDLLPEQRTTSSTSALDSHTAYPTVRAKVPARFNTTTPAASAAGTHTSIATLGVIVDSRYRGCRVQLPGPLGLQNLLEILQASLIPSRQEQKARLIRGGCIQPDPLLVHARAHLEKLLHLALLRDCHGRAPASRTSRAAHPDVTKQQKAL